MHYRRFILCALLILLLGFTVRLALYDFFGLDGDDGFSLSVSQNNDLGTLIPGLMSFRLDVNPPLHFLEIKGWTAVAGSSLLSLRLMNILVDLLTGAMLIRLASRVFTRRIGLAAGLLWSLAPLLIYSEYIIRIYTLMTMLVTAGVWCLVEALHDLRGHRSWWFAGMAACGVAAIYTHILGIVILGIFGLAIVAGWLARLIRIRDMLASLGWLAVAGILSLPYIGPAWTVYRSGRQLGAQLTSIHFANPLDVLTTVLNAILSHRLLSGPVVGILAVALVCLGSIVVLRRYGRVTAPLVVMFWAWLAAMTGLGWFAHIYKPQYLSSFVPITLAILAGMVFLLRRVASRVVLIALVCLSGWGVLGDLDHSLRDDWVATAQFIEQHERPGDLVLLIPDWGEPAFRFHYHGSCTVKAPFQGVSANMDLDALLSFQTQGYDGVWLIRYQPAVWDPNDLADAWFRSHAVTVTEVFPTIIQVKYYDFAPLKQTLPTYARPLDVRFGNVAALRGVYLPVDHGSARDSRLHPPSNWIQVILYWETLQTGANFRPQVRLIDGYGQVYGGTRSSERDTDLLHKIPVSTWKVGQIWQIAYDINVNPAAPNGTYYIEVMALDGATGTPLAATGPDTDPFAVSAAQFRIE